MSTIVVVRKAGRAVIAADTLGTKGTTKCDHKYFVDDWKILECGDSYVGIVGDAAHGHVFASIIRRHRKLLRFDSVDAIFETYRRLHPVLKDEYFLRTEEEQDDAYESSQMEALIANPHGIFGMFSWREVEEYTRFWATGSGWRYALGAMYAVYDRLDEPEEIARVGVEAGCEFDDGSGPPLEMHVVELNGRKPTKGSARRAAQTLGRGGGKSRAR